MNDQFAESLRKLREARGLSQKQLGEQIFTTQSTVARWENGRYLPDAGMILRIAKCLGVDAQMLYQLAAQSEEILNVIMVDYNGPHVKTTSKIILVNGRHVRCRQAALKT